MKNLQFIFLLTILFSCQVDSQPPTNGNESLQVSETKYVTPDQGDKVEIVFCLDATGSMGGLIETAKEKFGQLFQIWHRTPILPS